jgi:hypothetical protein
MGRVRLDTTTMAWHNGREVVRAMAPEFRANLGPEDRIDALFALYDQKTLWHDEGSTRRIDLIDVKPGYRDLTNAYHDSVEECLVLTGEVSLDGEGHFVAGDYFWRPAGFVHAAATEVGFRALLLFQGDDEAEHSGRNSRRIRPDEDAGTNQLDRSGPEVVVGPRGWVRTSTWTLPWIPGPVWSRAREQQLAEWDLERLDAKVLSENPVHGGQSVLLRLAPGFRGPAGALGATLDLYVLEGELLLGDDRLTEGAFLHLPAGATDPERSSPHGAIVAVWTDGWLTTAP